MATEITLTIWTASDLGNDTAHALANEVARQVRAANGGVEAEVAAFSAERVEPHDIVVAAVEFDAAAREEAESVPEFPEDTVYDESGYPAES